jgi:hypothetical protein
MAEFDRNDAWRTLRILDAPLTTLARGMEEPYPRFTMYRGEVLAMRLQLECDTCGKSVQELMLPEDYADEEQPLEAYVRATKRMTENLKLLCLCDTDG